MAERVEVGKIGGIPITYDPGIKRFEAEVGGKTIRSASQQKLETDIRRMTKSTKVKLLYGTTWECKVSEVEFVEVSKDRVVVREKNGDVVRLESWHVKMFDAKKFKKLEELEKEYARIEKAFEECWNSLPDADADAIRKIEGTFKLLEKAK